jgi:serine/threonine protein kinase
MLRQLGARVVPTWAALDGPAGGPSRLVVLERVFRGGAYGDQEIADWVRDARRMATLQHPNVARVRDVVIQGDEVAVVADFVDGVRWSELSAAAPRPPLELSLRVLVDALSGLSALHNLRDAKREPLKLVHGELTPECVVVGTDGVARIVSTCRPKSAIAQPGRGSAHLAPEVLLADESADARADVYSIGVMLWEALSGRPLFPNAQPSAIVTQLLSGRVARAAVPEGASWALPLSDVASRALSPDPEKRFVSAAALAAEIRRIAGPRLAPPARVGALVRATQGDRIRNRRADLESGVIRPPMASGIASDGTSEDIHIELEPLTEPTPAHNAPTKPPPPLPRTSKPPPPLPRSSKPPPLPMRARLPTLSGVAPAPVDAASGTASPVVVPSSSHPPPPLAPHTPIAAFTVPLAARVPLDLADDASTRVTQPDIAIAPAEPVPVVAPLPSPIAPPLPPPRLPLAEAAPASAPASEPTPTPVSAPRSGPAIEEPASPPAAAPSTPVTSLPLFAASTPAATPVGGAALSVPARPHKRRIVALALFIGPVIAALAATGLWLELRSTSRDPSAAASRPGPTHPPAAEPQAGSPPTRTQDTESPASAPAAATAAATSSADAPETVGPSSASTRVPPSPPPAAPPNLAAPPAGPPARPPPKRRYEPEGI